MWKRSSQVLLDALAVLVLLAVTSASGTAQVPHEETKAQIVQSVESHREELTRLSGQIWSCAEIALREEKSAELLASYLEGQGFTVERGVAEMPTAFVAEYGSEVIEEFEKRKEGKAYKSVVPDDRKPVPREHK